MTDPSISREASELLQNAKCYRRCAAALRVDADGLHAENRATMLGLAAVYDRLAQTLENAAHSIGVLRAALDVTEPKP